MADETLNLNALTSSLDPEIATSTRDVLLAFLRQTTQTDEKQFAFKAMPGDGERFVQRMRTELSRQRAKARQMNQKLKQFKVVIIKIETTPKYDLVVLEWKQTEQNILIEEAYEFARLLSFNPED